MRLLIGLGGNRGDVLGAFVGAVAALEREARVIARSSLWRSAPVGPPQPDYLNAAVLIDVAVPPHAVLVLCRRLEVAAGRDRDNEARLGPRTLDLDLLIVPGLVVDSPELVLPHPRLSERRFAVAPAAELAPEWFHSRARRTLKDLAESPSLDAQRCERVVPSSGWEAAPGGISRPDMW